MPKSICTNCIITVSYPSLIILYPRLVVPYLNLVVLYQNSFYSVPKFLHQTVCKNINLVCTFINYTEFTNAPLNVKPEGGGFLAKGRDLTIFTLKMSNATPPGHDPRANSPPPECDYIPEAFCL